MTTKTIEPGDASVGECEACGDDVSEDDASGDARACGVTLHIDCVGPTWRTHEFPSMRG